MSNQSEQALVARICHDLITPFNAINLGLEAYEMSQDSSLLSCVKDSVAKANSILKFMRELYSFKDQDFVYSSRSLESSMADFAKIYNIQLTLAAQENISYVDGKIMLYNTIILKELMPFGGLATFQHEDKIIKLKYEGRGITAINAEEELSSLNHRNVIKYGLLEWLKLNNYSFKSNINGDVAELVAFAN